MKIVLINLPSPWAKEPAMNPPLGLASISAYIKAHGFTDVVGIDLALSAMSPHIYWHIPKADVYGISCMTPQYKFLVQVCNHIRLQYPNAKIVVGGSHVTSIPEDLPESADIAIRGEGEYAFLQYLRGERVEPIIYRVEPEHLPIPDRDLFGLESYARTLQGEPAVHLVTLRGCPFNCSFCDRGSVGRKVRYRSVDNVLKELDIIIEKYNIRSFVIYDDIFTMDRKRTLAFCDEFRARGITWRCWSRADTLDRSLLWNMKNSGLSSITIGIESGDDEVLKRINKGTTVKKNREALLLCKELNIPVRCSLMYGNPGETIDSLHNTIKFIRETQPDEWNLAVLTPIPGSPIWDNPESFGITFDKEQVKDSYYTMVNRFMDTGIGESFYKHENFTEAEFNKYLTYFVESLERVCPRDNIQDTIQEINLKEERHERQESNSHSTDNHPA